MLTPFQEEIEMATNDSHRFVGGWTKIDWNPRDLKKYQYLFQRGGTLLIGGGDHDSYTLAWLDQNLRLHSISGFFYEGVTELLPSGLAVQAPIVNFECIVRLSISDSATSPTTLTGHITLASSGIGEGPVGIFTAEANPVGEEPNGVE